VWKTVGSLYLPFHTILAKFEKRVFETVVVKNNSVVKFSGAATLPWFLERALSKA
jgi:hypothetical protein